ncbi:hypothetical protein ACFC8F_17800 [Streptomyces hydrogenans]|uniref:hypothetical protein n=1 Tax=Streptomyces hydrogenans TaxID=1873719 RepID=UPI0035D573E2
MGLVVDLHGADGGEPVEADDLVEVGEAHPDPYGGLVGAEGNVPVEQGGQVPAPREGGALVGVDIRVGDVAAEVGEQPGTDE